MEESVPDYFMEHTIQTDVLVIGSGGAGCRAAIEARKVGQEVLMVSKGPVGRSGLTPMTMPGFAAVFRTRDKDDSPDVFFKDMLEGGYFLCNEKMVRIFAENASKAVLELESFGVKFDRTEEGEIEQYPLPSHSKRRGCRLDDNLGRVLLNALRIELIRTGVRVFEDFYVIDLLIHDGKVVGATGLSWDDGHFYSIQAKAVILATGGHEALYNFRTTGPRATGDGIGMALRAGAEIVDLEFMQFNPYAIIYPKGAMGVLVPMNGYIMTRGGKYRNNKGEPFVDKWDPIRKEATTRDVKAKAMFTEMVEGRGSKHGGVYLDVSRLQDLDGMPPKEVLRKLGGMHHEYLLQFGVDILTSEIEVAPAAHFGVGGIRINERTETSIRGLYAAGEVSGGLHGANRLDGASMPEIFVYGAIGGREAGAFAASNRPGKIPKEGIERSKKEIVSLLKNPRHSVNVMEAKKQLEEVMFNSFGIIREERGMESGMEKIEEMKQNILPTLFVRDRQLIGNYDLLEALEFRNMLEVARVMGSSALNRKESRGAHYRKDSPEMKEEWCRNTIVQQKGDRLKVFLREVVREEAKS